MHEILQVGLLGFERKNYTQTTLSYKSKRFTILKKKQ